MNYQVHIRELITIEGKAGDPGLDHNPELVGTQAASHRQPQKAAVIKTNYQLPLCSTFSFFGQFGSRLKF